MASGAARVRTGVEKRSFSEIAEIVVKSNADGSKIRVSDIASINIQEIDREKLEKKFSNEDKGKLN